MWEELQGSRLGVRFRRQQVVQGFIVDFYRHQAPLVVEADGHVHDLQKEEDERREKVLFEDKGITQEMKRATRCGLLFMFICQPPFSFRVSNIWSSRYFFLVKSISS